MSSSERKVFVHCSVGLRISSIGEVAEQLVRQSVAPCSSRGILRLCIRGMEQISGCRSNSDTEGMGMGGLNLGTNNSVDGNETDSVQQGSCAFVVQDETGGVFVVDENWGEEHSGDTPLSDQNGEYVGGFFCNDENGGVFLVGEDWNEENEEDDVGNCGQEKIILDSNDDILNMGDLSLFSPHEIEKYEFGNIDIAYKFYFEYGFANGFGIRKGRTLKKKNTLEEYQKELMCCRAGQREDRGLKLEDRVPEPRALTSLHCGMLPVYRRMSDSDVVQMNNMIKVGIRPPNIFNTFANQSGGYEKIGFRKKDMYNKISEQRRSLCSDAKGALEYLGLLRLSDSMMYFEHTVDGQGRLQHVFWSDGYSQVDYSIFGEVLAFDATYGKNKYFMPLVVFSGVNNHNRSTIFAAAIIANETEETYVWLLEQFSRCMKGKLPNAVVTDGDLAMKNAIERVFPNAYHRLCAWHLMRNATCNVKNADFTKGFEDCMLGYYDVGTFRRKWLEVVAKCGLEENPWVASLYEKRNVWATTYLRGKFFGGFRTTSRCEGLHSELGKFVNSRYNLSDFLQHFQRCLNHMRFKEKEDDFTSIHMVSQTGRSGEWRVSLYDTSKELKCACLKMESRGLPCEHIVAVLAHLGIDEIPESLVLKRWSKAAKDGLRGKEFEANHCVDAGRSARRAALAGIYDHVSEFHAATIEKFNAERDRLVEDWTQCRAEFESEPELGSGCPNSSHEGPRNPTRASTKGHAGGSSSSGIRSRKKQNCSICKLPGHNKTTCPSSDEQRRARIHDNVGGSSQDNETAACEDYEYFDPEAWL
ncbi:Zinc finger, PMZ-type [Sesbania bispinosa]|nr:Zinc finger, PMZ-type [Sesbania bispinosa]